MLIESINCDENKKEFYLFLLWKKFVWIPQIDGSRTKWIDACFYYKRGSV